MTKLKSVMAGIQWRGQWDIIGFGGDKWEFEVQVIKDTMVDSGEILKFELGVPGMEPFKECDFVIREERSLKDICDPLMLLCMRWQVVDVAGNGGLT